MPTAVQRGLIQPSYQQGLARSAGESARPEDWDGLVAAYFPVLGNVGDQIRDVSGHNYTLATQTAGWTWATTNGMRGAKFGAGSDAVANLNVTNLPQDAGAPWTMELYVSVTDYTSLAALMTWGENPFTPPAGNGGLRGFLMFGDSIYFFGDNADWDTDIDWDTTGAPHHLVFTTDATNLWLYVDGVERGTVAYPAAITDAAVKEIWLAGLHPSGAGGTFKGTIYSALLYDWRLPAGHIKDKAQDPFGMVRKRQPSLYRVPAAASIAVLRRRREGA